MKTLSKIILSAIVLIIMGSAVALGTLSPVRGNESEEVWDATMQYDIKDTITLQKKEGEDFVILNLTDIQFNDFFDIGRRKFTKDTIKEVINKTQPDLITLTGDQFWGKFIRFSAKELIEFMDSFEVPWAPVNGNHDGEGNLDLNALTEEYAKSKYCLFKAGPNNIGGVGNYVINIMEGEEIVQSLIMMDSGAGRKFDDLSDDEKIVSYELNDKFELELDEEGNYKTKEIGYNYDYIKPEQIEWYRGCIQGANAYNASKGASKPESMVFTHIALPEYYFAYCDYLKSGKDQSYGFFGAMREDVCCSKVNSGLFEAILQEGTTKNVFVGHDHKNDFSLLYKGVRLTYALKTGDRCYWEEGVNGGTVIKVGDTVEVKHEYVNVD